MDNDPVGTALADAETTIDVNGELPRESRATIRRLVLQRGQAWPRVEIEAVRRVLPRWTAFYPATLPTNLLALIEDYLAGNTERRRLEQATDELHAVVEDLDADGDDRTQLAGTVGWAATRAAWSAMDEAADDGAMDSDPYEWTASFTASMVAADGAVWDGRGNPDQRRDYWLWWLREAVPAAIDGNSRSDSHATLGDPD